MKKYISPKTKSVELNSEQAIILVCQVGGAYMGSSAVRNCIFGVGGGYACFNTPKRGSAAFSGPSNSLTDAPS